MKKNILLLTFTGMLFSLLTFSACKKDDVDSTKPEIVINEPEEEEQFAPGSELHLDVDFTDNESLNQYKVDIHSAEGHIHKSTAEKWVFEQTYDLGGLKNKHVHEHIDIPATIDTGDYHIVVYCTDKAGNENNAFKTFEVKIAGK